MAEWVRLISRSIRREDAEPFSNSYPRILPPDAARVGRFQQEARAVIALNHPNIVTIYEIGEEDSTYYIASELIEGETLRQRLGRGRMPLDEVIETGAQVASALAAAHKAGVVHRDIKPENIMLREDGYVKVLDFGIAKLTQSGVAEVWPNDHGMADAQTICWINHRYLALYVTRAGSRRTCG